MNECFAGIDISKATLDVVIRPSNEHWTVNNDEEGFGVIIERLNGMKLVVLEATGGLQVALTSVLLNAGIPVVAVNPRQIRDFAKSIGVLAKTDHVDAKVIARFAETIRPEVRLLKNEEILQLEAIVVRRRQIVSMQVEEKNRLHIAAIEQPGAEAFEVSLCQYRGILSVFVGKHSHCGLFSSRHGMGVEGRCGCTA